MNDLFYNYHRIYRILMQGSITDIIISYFTNPFVNILILFIFIVLRIKYKNKLVIRILFAISLGVFIFSILSMIYGWFVFGESRLFF